MNILYCGDNHIKDGLIISILSLLHQVKTELHIYVLTMKYSGFEPVNNTLIEELSRALKTYNPQNTIDLIDITELFKSNLPDANIDTRFTPYCMLRLYSDLIEELPAKILYLDTDVVCLKDPSSLYSMNNQEYEVIGVYDYYGSHIYKKNMLIRNYMNSGVLNLKLIKKTKLFSKCRFECKTKKMLLPDQAALNKYVTKKLIISSKYNEQHKEKKETVFRHFTTTFKFFPYFHTESIKPWNIEQLHQVLKVHSFDVVLVEYKEMIERLNNEKTNNTSILYD